MTFLLLLLRILARGQQKLRSQAKTQENATKAKKQQGHSLTEYSSRRQLPNPLHIFEPYATPKCQIQKPTISILITNIPSNTLPMRTKTFPFKTAQ